MTAIAATVLTRDTVTGEERAELRHLTLAPPPLDRCQICAAKHELAEPHDPTTLYAQTLHTHLLGRAPTWADALAHCAEPVRTAWRAQLKERGQWTQPPKGEAVAALWLPPEMGL